jgi:hypothetical protein
MVTCPLLVIELVTASAESIETHSQSTVLPGKASWERLAWASSWMTWFMSIGGAMTSQG